LWVVQHKSRVCAARQAARTKRANSASQSADAHIDDETIYHTNNTINLAVSCNNGRTSPTTTPTEHATSAGIEDSDIEADAHDMTPEYDDQRAAVPSVNGQPCADDDVAASTSEPMATTTPVNGTSPTLTTTAPTEQPPVLSAPLSSAGPSAAKRARFEYRYAQPQPIHVNGNNVYARGALRMVS
jgi:hypothetical protein